MRAGTGRDSVHPTPYNPPSPAATNPTTTIAIERVGVLSILSLKAIGRCQHQTAVAHRNFTSASCDSFRLAPARRTAPNPCNPWNPWLKGIREIRGR